MLLARLYLQLGVFLDYYTGQHGLSYKLRDKLLATHHMTSSTVPTFERGILVEDVEIPPEHLSLFPQFSVTSSWPSSFLVHGAQDSAVLVEESHAMEQLLADAGVPVTLRVIPGQEHSFDYAPTAEKFFGEEGGVFNEVRDFLVQQLFN